MDDQEFFDSLHQVWSKTTGVLDDGVWHVEDDGFHPNLYTIIASSHSDDEPVANYMDESDAQFIATMHNVFPEIMRRFLEAQDTARVWEERYDDATGQLAEAELRIMNLEESLYGTPKDEAW